MKKELPLTELGDLAGRRIGTSDWMIIDQDRIDRFAAATDDYQWIHVDPARAAKAFGSTIAHGFLTLSMIPHLVEQVSIVPAGTKISLNYGINKARLISPVPVGASIRDVVVFVSLEKKDAGRIITTTRHTIEIQGSAKPACVAETLAMHILGASTPDKASST
jgi:acyl dehydratase